MSVTTAQAGIEESTAGLKEQSAAPARHAADLTWVWQVTALSLVLGVMLALAIRTTSQRRRAGQPLSRFGVSAAILSTYKEQNEGLQKEIKDLRQQVSKYEQSVKDDSRFTELLKKEIQQLKAASGLAAVRGPGLKVLLQDSKEASRLGVPQEDYDTLLVHDGDINGLIGELKAAGAEALALSGADGENKQRVVVTTTARCVGPNAVVNGTQLSAPYTIWAIGNPKELRAALEMPNGFVQVRGLDALKMIVIEEAQEIDLPEFTGSFSSRYARPSTANE